MARDNLATYLFDHYAGSEAALEMMDHLETAYPNSQAATVIAQIRPELLFERGVLQKIMAAMSVEPSATRRAFGWFSEKMVEIKLHLDDPAGAQLRLLESVEMLSIGISGKIALWKALDNAKDSKPVLGNVEYPRLLDMALAQHSRIEAVRINAARDAFSAA